MDLLEISSECVYFPPINIHTDEDLSKYFTICVHPDLIMSHGGSTDPCAAVHVTSIGKLGPDVNKDHSKTIGSFIHETLNIPMDRFYIQFNDVPPASVGYNGTTF
ncbi:macrophage migration inhibitory factor isoform X2 [Octopus bimaculoides]|uniref:macrophage migration inhibitory factor isoform X2 n=1 Tax=Octopus bimaculoides TaxID=37653 RepID=UPI0022E089CB|nr:macrophage migration inhibitory factor isoform X2 [Octopus bimaculoides]